VSFIKGLQLRLVQKLYGIPPAQIRGVTELDTENAQQTIPLVPEILRRSDNILGLISGGWFEGVMENVHSGADDEVCSLNPYIPGAAAGPGFPSPVPDGWDIWILGASLLAHSGAGSAVIILDINTGARGLGIDDQGAAVTATPLIILQRWTSIVADVGGLTGYGIDAQGKAWQPIGVRVPRGADMELRGTSDAAVSYRAAIIMGIFPEGMGQDVAG